MDMADIKDYEKYTHPLGHVKAREIRIISKKHMMEFAAVGNLEELLKGLEDTDYGPFITRSNGRYEEAVEKAMSAELRDVVRVLGKEKKWVVGLFRIKYDVNNLKILVKSKLANEKSPPSFSFFGMLNPKELAELWSLPMEEILRNLEGDYRGLVEKSIENYGKDEDLTEFDNTLEKGMFSLLFRKIPEGREGEFFRKYFAMEIDFHNLLTFLRLKRDGKEDGFERFFISGGEIRKERITSLEIGATHCGRVWEQAKEEYERSGALTSLERLSKSELMRFTEDRSRLKPFSPESIAAFVLMKEQEALTVRLLLGIKAKEVPVELAKKLVGDAYA